MIHPSTSTPKLVHPNLPAVQRAAGRLCLVLVGDSTVCNYPPDSPCRGWGQYFSEAFSEAAQVINLAKTGASTKTFREEGLWELALNLKPDWVLIQMGHNDSHASENPESTRADGDYAANLRRFVCELRANSAQAVLVTPVRRFTFDEDERLLEGDSALEPYAKAMHSIGCELEIPVVDLFESSTEFFSKLGPTGANRLSPEPGKDFSHFNETGARAIAKLVIHELTLVAPVFGRLLYSLAPLSKSL